MGAFASGSLIGPGTLPMADHFKTWGVTATLAALERAKEVTAKREATLRQVSTAQSSCWASPTATPSPKVHALTRCTPAPTQAAIWRAAKAKQERALKQRLAQEEHARQQQVLRSRITGTVAASPHVSPCTGILQWPLLTELVNTRLRTHTDASRVWRLCATCHDIDHRCKCSNINSGTLHVTQ